MTDTTDKYYIHKINDMNLNGKPFLCLQELLGKLLNWLLGWIRDSSVEDPIKDEVIYFDGMQKRVKQWTTSRAMGIPPTHNDAPEIYNHGIQGETKESATLFWNLFNRILQEVTNDVV